MLRGALKAFKRIMLRMTIVSCLFECLTQHIQLNILKLRSPMGIVINCGIRVSWIDYGTFSFWNLELHRFVSSWKILCIESISRQGGFQPVFQNSRCAFIQNPYVLNFVASLRKCQKRTTVTLTLCSFLFFSS